ncbi:hypothetical protein C1H46_030023 [Malus baccata]|uniref:Uncharacterized protein n=1 Tax=Malus baccata TaxID=106549 RepID=A0A540LDA9_MALBA|nr:hypothetical protein C1H46_030023 [Malus baccata]
MAPITEKSTPKSSSEKTTHVHRIELQACHFTEAFLYSHSNTVKEAHSHHGNVHRLLSFCHGSWEVNNLQSYASRLCYLIGVPHIVTSDLICDELAASTVITPSPAALTQSLASSPNVQEKSTEKSRLGRVDTPSS